MPALRRHRCALRSGSPRQLETVSARCGSIRARALLTGPFELLSTSRSHRGNVTHRGTNPPPGEARSRGGNRPPPPSTELLADRRSGVETQTELPAASWSTFPDRLPDLSGSTSARNSFPGPGQRLRQTRLTSSRLQELTFCSNVRSATSRGVRRAPGSPPWIASAKRRDPRCCAIPARRRGTSRLSSSSRPLRTISSETGSVAPTTPGAARHDRPDHGTPTRHAAPSADWPPGSSPGSRSRATCRPGRSSTPARYTQMPFGRVGAAPPPRGARETPGRASPPLWQHDPRAQRRGGRASLGGFEGSVIGSHTRSRVVHQQPRRPPPFRPRTRISASAARVLQEREAGPSRDTAQVQLTGGAGDGDSELVRHFGELAAEEHALEPIARPGRPGRRGPERLRSSRSRSTSVASATAPRPTGWRGSRPAPGSGPCRRRGGLPA